MIKDFSGKDLKECVDWLMREKCGCCHFHLLTDDKGRKWSVVVGWSDGFDDDTDLYKDGTWRVCTMIAYQEYNNFMQTDFNIDFTMPYDEESGEVDNTCHYIGNITEVSDFNVVAEELKEEFNRVVSEWAYIEVEEEEVA